MAAGFSRWVLTEGLSSQPRPHTDDGGASKLKLDDSDWIEQAVNAPVHQKQRFKKNVGLGLGLNQKPT